MKIDKTCENHTPQIEVECIFRALQGPLNLHCIRIRAVVVRTPYTLIKYTEISGPPESTEFTLKLFSVPAVLCSVYSVH